MHKKINYIFIFSVGIMVLIAYQIILGEKTKQKFTENQNENDLRINTNCDNYRMKCDQLFKKLRYPNQSLIIKPPPQMPPADLIKRFTQDGAMPIIKQWYINEAYADSNSIQKETQGKVTVSEFNEWLTKVKNNQKLVYYNVELQITMKKYLNEIKDKSLVVLGTQQPWVEAIGYYLNASQITTLDYTRKIYELDRLEWLHVNDYLDDLISNKKEVEQFDNSASFSSIEHSGLGRYGDPLSPEGDIDAVQQVHCLLKPNGLFFLGLPTSNDNSSYIEFNAHRVYGSKRLDLLLNGWTQLEQVKCVNNVETIFVLRKNSLC
jgi:hypothetical protein